MGIGIRNWGITQGGKRGIYRVTSDTKEMVTKTWWWIEVNGQRGPFTDNHMIIIHDHQPTSFHEIKALTLKLLYRCK